ncbi:MAG TPA: tetratricopeptide repeat protein [Geobacteraceae bacterium]
MTGKNRYVTLRTLTALAMLAAAVVVSYWPVLDNLFVIYDDPEYVTENGPVLAGLTWKACAWAFTTVHTGNWHPLTWLSHMADVSLYGLDPRGHHLTNLVLHTANALLLFTLLRRLTGKDTRSLAVALLFALHPLHVESVAWVAERKDVLSGLFFLLTLLAYHRYTLRPGPGRMAPVALALAAGLAAKQMLVTTPVVLLLLDRWPLGRLRDAVHGDGSTTLRRLCVEKIPLFLLAAAGAAITFVSHRHEGAVAPLVPRELLINAANAAVAATAYLGKMLWPARLAVFYPYSPDFPPPLALAGACLIIVLLSWGTWRWRRRAPWLFVGWYWYLVTLLPVSGVVRIGSMAMADRYTYLPLIGPFIALVWGAAELLAPARARVRRSAVGAACLVIILLATLTWRQTRHWHDSITLFGHTVSVTRDNWLAWNNLGVAWLLRGGPPRGLNIARFLGGDVPGTLSVAPGAVGTVSLQRAQAAFREAVRIRPGYESAHFNLGLAALRLGDRETALAEYRILLRIDPRAARNLAVALGAE